MTLVATVGTSQASIADSGIGGGTSFTNGSIFPFISGLTTSLSSSFFVQNIGDDDMELEIIHGAPRGITIEPSEEQELSLAPFESTLFFFDITVDETVPADSYPIIINLRQSNFEQIDEPGSIYRPALAASFVVDVIGASATLNFSAISALNGLPAQGDLSLFYLGENGIDTLIYQENASEFSLAVVPGNYRATFDIPNLQRQSVEFTIEDGETRDVVLEIPTLEFLSVGAIPTRDDRDVIQFVTLSMDVFNNLRQLQGPIDFVSKVYLDDELVDEFIIETLPFLPEGETLQRAVYDLDGGFAQGDWKFEFGIRNEEFEVYSTQTLIVPSPGLLQSYIQEILLVLFGLIIAGLLLPKSWWAIILRRRKKDSAEEPALVSIPVDTTAPPVKRRRAPVKPEVNLEPVLGKAREFFAAITKQKEKDPYSIVKAALVEIDELEALGARTLKFSFDMDKIFASDGESVKKKSSGRPYSPEELKVIARYEDAKGRLERVARPDLESQIRRDLMMERIESSNRRSQGGVD